MSYPDAITMGHPSASRREFRQEVCVKYPDGPVYTGEWVGNQKDGEGQQVWPGGQKYVGQFCRGGVHGEGVYTQPDGLRYTGQWHSGKQHGHGTEFFKDDQRYVGQYKDGKLAGMGLYSALDGSVYEGQFSDDRLNGEGVYIWSGGSRGRKYRGQWLNNTMHGKGEFSFADGRKYYGEYLCNKKHGNGTFSWPDGREYAGQWRFGKPHGLGVFTTANQSKIPGVWKEGEEQHADRPPCCMQMQRSLGSSTPKSLASQQASSLLGASWEAPSPGGLAKENAEAHCAPGKAEATLRPPPVVATVPIISKPPRAPDKRDRRDKRDRSPGASSIDSDEVVAPIPLGGELQDILDINLVPSFKTKPMEGLTRTPQRSPRDDHSAAQTPADSPTQDYLPSTPILVSPRTILGSDVDEHGDEEDWDIMLGDPRGKTARTTSRVVSL